MLGAEWLEIQGMFKGKKWGKVQAVFVKLQVIKKARDSSETDYP